MWAKMNVSAQQIELDIPDTPSVFPWVLALACATCLVFLVNQLVDRIQATLLENARSEIASTEFKDIQVSISGRDLYLNGSIDIGNSSAELVTKLAQIEGVNRVDHSLTMIDPVQLAEISSQQFQRAISEIDISSVSFQPGSVSITTESTPALQQLVALMQQHPETRIRIEGHTDNTGPSAVNLRVSRERAAAVSNYLVNNGVSSDRLIVKGYGDAQPVDSNDSEAGRARNRRIEISYVY